MPYLAHSMFPRSVAAACAALLVSCGGGPTDGGSGGNGSPASGHFYDSAVHGLAYSSGSKSGVTDAAGTFTFIRGSNVTFKVGGIALGSVPAATRMSPVNLVAGALDETNNAVTNIARFLQTIDDDGDLSNGILITAAVRAAAAGKAVNFNQATTSFGSSVQSVVSALTLATSAGERTLVDATTARNNLVAGVRAGFAGNYGGNYCLDNGASAGTWTMTVQADGSVFMVFTGTPGFTATGSMDVRGVVNAATSNGGTVAGTFGPDFGGQWYDIETSGTFSEGAACL
jgi:hypothetical protein